MAQKKAYPGGFRLTRKTAAALAAMELGTARGLEPKPGMPEGYFHIRIGNLEIRIRPDISGSSSRSSSSLIQMVIGTNCCPERIVQFFDPETLEEDFQEEDIRRLAKRREVLEDWVSTKGPEFCRAEVDRIWKGEQYG